MTLYYSTIVILLYITQPLLSNSHLLFITMQRNKEENEQNLKIVRNKKEDINLIVAKIKIQRVPKWSRYSVWTILIGGSLKNSKPFNIFIIYPLYLQPLSFFRGVTNYVYSSFKQKRKITNNKVYKNLRLLSIFPRTTKVKYA